MIRKMRRCMTNERDVPFGGGTGEREQGSSANVTKHSYRRWSDDPIDESQLPQVGAIDCACSRSWAGGGRIAGVKIRVDAGTSGVFPPRFTWQAHFGDLAGQPFPRAQPGTESRGPCQLTLSTGRRAVLNSLGSSFPSMAAQRSLLSDIAPGSPETCQDKSPA